MQGSTVMITGGTGNVGRAVAHRFASEGANLILVDRNQERLKPFCDELSARYSVTVYPAALDVLDTASVDRVIAEANEKFGGIEILVHTVGGFAFGDPVYAMNMETFEQQLNLNVRPLYTLVGHVVKHMIDSEIQGNVVILLSRAAVKGSANSSAYTATKAAAQSIMESLSLEVRDKGINVNGIMPSIIDTPPNRKDMPKADFSKWVTVDDIANAVYFLSTDAAKSLHGISLEVYGRA